MKSPLIGVTMYRDKEYYKLDCAYLEAVSQTGGIPVLIPYSLSEAAFRELIKKCDGLLLAGGEDVDPNYYHEEPQLRLEKVAPDRDHVEFQLLSIALDLKKPILAICRGVQVLTVGMGGSLFQDIPSQCETLLQHYQKSPHGHATHSVSVKADTMLAELLQATMIRVNSLHHQAVKKVPAPLRVTATSSDGVIEAVESVKHPFVLGIQWHPEELAIAGDIYAQRIFKGFVQACIQERKVTV